MKWRDKNVDICLKIDAFLYGEIIKFTNNYSREVGGFIGIKNNVIIKCWFDDEIAKIPSFSYKPNELKLNHFWDICELEEIEYLGIFHSHLNKSATLSNGDINFIKNFMNINVCVSTVFFPVIIPGKEMRVYCAKRDAMEITICEVKVQIINN